MSAEPTAVRLVRQALEQSIPERDAAVLLFDALARWSDRIPATKSDILEVVRGPMQQLLTERLGSEEAEQMVQRIGTMVNAADMPAGREGSFAADPSTEPPRSTPAETDDEGPVIEIVYDEDEGDALGATDHSQRPTHVPPPEEVEQHSGVERRPGPSAEFEQRVTAALPLTEGPVPVLVVASGSGFAARVASALGTERVSASRSASPERIRERLQRDPPAIVLVDASDFPPVPPEQLATVLRTVPSGVIVSVWGAELPFGRPLVEALEGTGARCIALARTEGFEPVFDIVRARRFAS